MKYLKQFGIILALSFVGELLHDAIPLPVPASIYGIILLFLLLECRILPLSAVKEASAYLIAIMPVMFIPAAVGLLTAWDQVKTSWPSFLLVTFLSTVIVMAAAGSATQFIIRRKEKRHHESE